MTGFEMKQRIKEAGYSLSEVARLLGYPRRQRLYKELVSDDLKSGLIERISHAIDKNIGWFYGEEAMSPTQPENSLEQATKEEEEKRRRVDWTLRAEDALMALAKETAKLQQLVNESFI